MDKERLEVSYITAIEAWAREGYTIEVELNGDKITYSPNRLFFMNKDHVIDGRWFIRRPKEEK